MNAAIRAETLKMLQSMPARTISVVFPLGVIAVSAVILTAPERDSAVLSQKVSAFTSDDGWLGLTILAGVVAASGGLLACGTLLAWLFGREFVDGAVAGLFALPTSRVETASAKFVVYLVWLLAVSLMLPGILLVVGLASGLGVPDRDGVTGIVKLAAIVSLTGLLALPCAWIATRTRGYLAPIGVAVGIIVLAQMSVFAGTGAWLPFAAPGLWAGIDGTNSANMVRPVQLLIILPIGVVFAGLCLHAWRGLRL